MVRILIVDDVDDNRYFLRALLEGNGCEVEEAHHGAEALLLARARRPAVVVSDLLMPVMDGYTLLRHWRDDERLRSVPFIVYTATYTDPKDEQLALDLGADAFVVKPAEPEAFVAQILEIVGRVVQIRRHPVRQPKPEGGEAVEAYNKVLVRKLEEKMLRLGRANAELADREARLRAILDTEPECVAVVAPDGTLLDMNPAGLRMIEADSITELTGLPLDQLVVDEDREAFSAFFRKVLGGESGTLEYGIVGLKGTRRQLEIHAQPLHRVFERLTVFLGIARDVTERRERESSLQEARERLQLAIRAGNVGLWDWDLRTNEVVFSTEWMRHIGYGDAELAPDLEEWRKRVHPDDLSRVLEHVQAHLAGKDPTYEAQFRLRHKDGSYRNILAHGAVVRQEDGAPVRMLGSHIDITEQTQLQRQFLQAQKMESVGRLAGGIAHDFNNLLTIINASAELALANMPEADPHRPEYEQILGTGQRGATLTRQLLAFSRRQILRPAVLDLNAVVSGMYPMLRRLIGENVELTVSSADAAGTVLADQGQIEQVIMNLVVNASDAMPGGGRLTIETRNVTLDESYVEQHSAGTPGPNVMLTVRDTGLGMDAETKAHIFEPFFTTKGVGRGTGLGLSTVYGIVKQSGGTIWVYSELGEGTIFRVYLPRSGEIPEPECGPTVAKLTRGHETILLVEDEKALLRVATRILESAGYTVLTAASGREALERIDRLDTPVDLVLTDIVLPDISGRELARQIQERRPGLKILQTSGYTDDEILRQGIRDASTHFIGKPYGVTDLTRKVREVLDSRPADRGGPGGAG